MPREIIYATVRDGKIIGEHFWLMVSLIEGPAEFTVQRYHRKRSAEFNRYYWGGIVAVAVQFVREHGTTITASEVHEMHKAMFLKEDVHIGDGLFISKIAGSSTLDKEKFDEFCTKCVAYWSELGCQFLEKGQQATIE